MKQFFQSKTPVFCRAAAGLTLIEVVVASAIAALAALMLYPAFLLANSLILANRQKLEAEALVMDQIMVVFNTFDFDAVRQPTNLPPVRTPAGGLLPTNSEIRVMIVPGLVSNIPYKWDLEARIKRDRIGAGGKTVALTNDTVYRITRYNVGRN